MSMTGRYLRVSPEAVERVLADPAGLSDWLYSEDATSEPEAEALDIDKDWHIIHFLLTGTGWEGASPLADIVLGGEELTDEDLGYGPARCLRPAAVRSAALAVAAIPPEALWERYDPVAAESAELYWSDVPEARPMVVESYQLLREFFVAAAKAKQAIVLWLA